MEIRNPPETTPMQPMWQRTHTHTHTHTQKKTGHTHNPLADSMECVHFVNAYLHYRYQVTPREFIRGMLQQLLGKEAAGDAYFVIGLPFWRTMFGTTHEKWMGLGPQLCCKEVYLTLHASSAYTHTRTHHTHTCSHHMHTHTHACTHTRMRAHTHTHTHTCTHQTHTHFKNNETLPWLTVGFQCPIDCIQTTMNTQSMKTHPGRGYTGVWRSPSRLSTSVGYCTQKTYQPSFHTYSCLS